MDGPSRAVFLSYASEDFEAARTICDAFRAGGAEVWFDKTELRGGDAWDEKIRQQVRECALFVPIISRTTARRQEGYFRLEWTLADQRSQMIARNRPFIFPIRIDDVSEASADVPASFLRVQWTQAFAQQPLSAIAARISALLATESGAASEDPQRRDPATGAVPALVRRGLRPVWWMALALGCLLASGLGALRVARLEWPGRPQAPEARAIPDKSVVVLPFANLSADKDNEYFSDGLTEEMIDLLGQDPELRVPGRTSSFFFKGKNVDLATIAKTLQVAHVLEGSVRKMGKRLRITAQLIRTDNDKHVWSQTYDRDDNDIFAVQDEIAKSVFDALHARLGGPAKVLGARGTGNPEAYARYLVGRNLHQQRSYAAQGDAVRAFDEALALDPQYAAAYAERAVARAIVAGEQRDFEGVKRALADADRAISLAPDDAHGYSSRSYIESQWFWDWRAAQSDIETALRLDPRSSDVQHRYALLLIFQGRLDAAIAAEKKALEGDPLFTYSWQILGYAYTCKAEYALAESALARGTELSASPDRMQFDAGTLWMVKGEATRALAAFGKVDNEPLRLMGLSISHHLLGDKIASQKTLDQLIANYAGSDPYPIAAAYAWRGQPDQAFAWIRKAHEQHGRLLPWAKTDPLLLPLRADARWPGVLATLNLME